MVVREVIDDRYGGRLWSYGKVVVSGDVEIKNVAVLTGVPLLS